MRFFVPLFIVVLVAVSAQASPVEAADFSIEQEQDQQLEAFVEVDAQGHENEGVRAPRYARGYGGYGGFGGGRYGGYGGGRYGGFGGGRYGGYGGGRYGGFGGGRYGGYRGGYFG